MSQQLIDNIRQSVIGDKQLIPTSFGLKPLVYADYTASGRSLTFIEDYIKKQVLPFYANTHTETSYTGAQSTKLREEARNIVHNAVNGSENDHVVFCGPGATAAINKLIDILNIRLPKDLNDQYSLLKQIPQEQRPVVFIGPYEHHSNELPWRESIADVVTIPLDQQGQINQQQLALELERFSERPLKIGSFSAASNVTGIKSSVTGITELLHQHQALSFWDYAAGAPYMGIDMNPQDAKSSAIDAVFFSTHKFIGGPGTPGVLVVKDHMLNNSVPSTPGGGTVSFVTPSDHQYVASVERREEGGTPGIVESIRAGLVVKLQQDVGTKNIEQREHDFIQKALSRWQQHENINVLGNTKADRLSIVSLTIKHKDQDLHYGFVVALLNDLFGIQARGGCSCAGPYGHSLLGMDMELSRALELEMAKGQFILRPGWVRLNFNYFIDEQTFEYLTQAIEMIAQHGYKLLPYYQYNEQSGSWCYQGKSMKLSSDLNSIDFTKTDNSAQPKIADDLMHFLVIAQEIFNNPEPNAQTYDLSLSESAEKLRWFVLPQSI